MNGPDLHAKRPVGRPRTIENMREYKALKAREYRAKRKVSSPKPIPQNTIEKEEK